MSARFTIRLFGAFDVRVQGQPLPRLRTRRGQWLLALLVLRHDREVRRRWLAGTVWPDSTESQALRSLRQTLADLRRALGPEAHRLASPRAGALCLSLEGARADVALFDAAAAGDDLATLEQAAALYRGPLLEGWTEEWVFEERQAREQAYLKMLDRLARRALEQGEWAAGTRALRRAIATDPLRESAHRALMEALGANGEYAAAAEVYRDLRLLLHHQLNEGPAPETTACYETIRREARAKAGALPGSVPPPIRAPAAPPRPLTALLGREEEVRVIRSLMSGARLVTLTGAGGVGKSRLAIHAAREALEGPGEAGVAFVDLATVEDPAQIPGAVAAAAGLADGPTPLLAGALAAALRERLVLLVLDNCEHLADACARLARVLLASCPDLRILSAGQQPLGVAGEVTWRVPPLALPAAWERPTTEALGRFPAVRLFVERARAVQPDFQLTAGNSDAVLDICRRLEGVPLPLELAAAWIRALTAQQLAARLADGFPLLPAADDPPARDPGFPRQRTLRATLERSVGLLTAEEKTLLARLSAFAGGWTLDAAARVCWDGNPEVLVPLARLIDKSLVLRGQQPETRGDSHPEARYRLLETVRQFAREHLERTGEAERLRDLHRDYFRSLSERAEAASEGAGRGPWLDRLETEHDNLRAAESSGDGELELATSLWWFRSVRGHWKEGRARLEEALASRPGAPPPRRAPALLRAGMLAFRLADYRAAERLYQQSFHAHREARDRAGLARSLYRLGELAAARGEFGAADRLMEESLSAARASGDSRIVARSLAGLGSVAELRGRTAAAFALYRQSLALARNPDARSENIALLLQTAHLLRRIGDPRARPLQEEALALSREVGDRGGVAFSLNCLGVSRLVEGKAAAAKELFTQALTIGRELSDERSVAFSLHHGGLAAHAGGDALEAAALLREALAKRAALDDIRGAAASRRALRRAARDATAGGG